MKIQSISCLIGLSLFASQMVYAQDASSPAVNETEAETVKDRVNRLNAEGKALREEAQETYVSEEHECYRKFLVNHCIDKAKQKRLEKIVSARQKETEARQLHLGEKQRAAAEAQSKMDGRSVEPLTGPTAETVDPVIEPVPASEQIRAERAAHAKEAEAAARQARQQQDAERAAERAEAEAEAAARAKQAERDRQRYDERIRQYEDEKEKENK